MMRLAKASPWLRIGAVLAAIVLVLDQVTKWLILNVVKLPEVGSIEILPFFSLTMVWNRGISMGMLQMDSEAGKWMLVGLTVAVTIFLVHWLWKAENRLVGLSLGIVIGGAIGNIIDRIAYGAVADFMHFYAGGHHFYVFNVADACITIGIVGLLIDSLRGGFKSPKRNEKKPDDSAGVE